MENKSFDLIPPVTCRLIHRFWIKGLLVSLSAVSAISQSAFSSSTHAGELSLNLFRESVDKVKDCNSMGNVPKAKVQASYGKLPLYFIQNTGQMDEKIQFYEKGCGRSIFFTKRGIYLSFVSGQQPAASSQRSGISRPWWHGLRRERSVERQTCLSMSNMSKFKTETVRGKAENKPSGTRNPHSAIEESAIQNPQSKICNPTSEVIKFVPIGANKTLEIIAERLQEGKVSYFIGNDENKWKTNIPTYRAVAYKDIYKNIDMRFYGNNRQMEYDIIVKPGANPSRVRFAYRGIEDLRVTDEGDLEIYLKGGKLIQKKPCIYQEIDGKRVAVGGEFKVSRLGSKVQKHKTRNSKLATRNPQLVCGFQVASYDKRYPLIIDPGLVYSTYLGGSSFDNVYGIAVDTSGNAYVTGYTSSTDFPTVNAIYGSNAGVSDAFITKLNASGSSLVYSTYLGGNSTDAGFEIAVDTSGNAYVTGETGSTNFPTVSAIDGSKAGINDAFITKLNASGNALAYSTYLGGSRGDIGLGIAIDTSGNAYVTGYTYSTDFPTVNAIYGSNAGVSDAFITKLNASGSSLAYSTYLGGSREDDGRGIAVDTSGNAYVTGGTISTDFPTVNAIYGSNAGVSDAFITKLNASGSSLAYSTYLGGSREDDGRGIAVDTSGNAYVTGGTISTDFPTVNAIYGSNAGGFYDAFITKLNASGNALVYSTYLGGSSDDVGLGIAIDTSGNAYVTGYTGSTDFPTVSAIDGSKAGISDAFITKLNTSVSLAYSTYLGGSSEDYGYGIAVDASGNAYVTGRTISTDFPTVNATYGSNEGGDDAFITKLNASGSSLVYSTYLGGSSFDDGLGIAVDISGNAYVVGETYSSNFPTVNPIYGSNSNAGFPDVFITKIASDTIYGYIVGNKDEPIESARVKLRGKSTKIFRSTFSDDSGFFQFADLPADAYVVSAKKKGYKKTKEKVALEEGEVKEIELKMKKK